MFAAGVEKVRFSGVRWADGGFLGEVLAIDSCPENRCIMLPGLRNAIRGSPVLLCLMNAASLLLELSAPAALLSRTWRHLVAVGGIAFHIGILVLMRASFTCNCVCYLALIDWPLAETQAAPAHRGSGARLARRTANLLAAGGVAVVAAMCVPTVASSTGGLSSRGIPCSAAT